MNKLLPALIMGAAVTTLSGCTGLFDKDNTPTPTRLASLPVGAKPIKVLWQTNTGKSASTELPNMTPAINGNRIFTAAQNGQITALNRHTGQILWQTQTNLPLSAGVSVNDRTVFAGTRKGVIIALDQANGKQRWTAQATSEILATPTASNTRVMVKSIDNRITAFSAVNGRRLWSAFERQPELILHSSGAPRFGTDSVYVGYEDGTLARYKLTNGGQYWKQTIADSQGLFPIQRMVDIDSDPIVTRHRVFAATWQGQLASVKTTTGEIEWSRPISTYTTLAYDGSAIYLSDAKGHVSAFGASSGRHLWKQSAMEAHRLTGPALDDRYLVIGDAEGWVHWLKKSNGAPVTRFKTSSGVFATPLISNHTAYVATLNGQLTALRMNG